MVTSLEAETRGYAATTPAPVPEACEFCGAALYYRGMVMGDNTVHTWMSRPARCECAGAVEYWELWERGQAENEALERLQAERKAQLERIRKYTAESGIKGRFLNRTFDKFIVGGDNCAAYAAAKDYADNFVRYAKAGEGLYFEGTYGTGKTHLATAIALRLLDRGVPVICKTSIDLYNDIKRTFDRNDGISEYEVLKIYKDAELLVIDDLGKEQATDWNMAALYSILNDRYETMRPVVITTNYNDEALIGRLTPRGGDSVNIGAMISRLHGVCKVVTMAWGDCRVRYE